MLILIGMEWWQGLFKETCLVWIDNAITALFLKVHALGLSLPLSLEEGPSLHPPRIAPTPEQGVEWIG